MQLERLLLLLLLFTRPTAARCEGAPPQKQLIKGEAATRGFCLITSIAQYIGALKARL